MDLILILNELWKKKWLLLLAPIFSAALVFLLTVNQEKKYKSTSQLATGYTVKDGIDFTQERQDHYTINTKFTNLIETMNSTMVLSLLSYNILLKEMEGSSYLPKIDVSKYGISPDTVKDILELKLKNFEILSPSIPNEVLIHRILKDYSIDPYNIRNNLIIKRLDISDYLLIQFISNNPQLSAYAVNTLTNEFVRYYNALARNRSTASIDFFSKMVNDTRRHLDEKTAELKDFKSHSKIVKWDVQSDQGLNQLKAYEAQREEVIKRIRGLQQVIDRMNRETRSTATATETGSSAERIVRLKKELTTLNQEYNVTGNPELLKKIDAVKVELQMAIINDEGSFKNKFNTGDDQLKQKKQYEQQLEMAKGELESINEAIYKMKANVAEFSSVEDTIRSLEREVNLASEEYLLALDKLSEAKKASMISESSIRPIIYGQPSLEPEPDKRKLVILFAAAGTFGLIASMIFVLAYFDNSIRTPSEFKKLTGLAISGFTYPINKKTIGNLLDGKGKRTLIEKYILDQIRSTRYQLNVENSKIYVFTSTKKLKEKPFFLYMLGKSFVDIGQKVLIIDLNFKESSLTSLLYPNKKPKSLINKMNITSASHEVAIVEEEVAEIEHINGGVLQDIVEPTKVEGLDMVACAFDDRSPSEIFDYYSLKEFLAEASRSYDKVLIDSASLTQYPDTKELLSLCDMVVLMASAADEYKEEDLLALDLVKKSARNTSILLNVDKKFL